MPGGEYLCLARGASVRTSTDQRVSVVGFSATWDRTEQLSQKENDVLTRLSLCAYPQDAQDKVVGLFFDKDARERQELIKLNLFEVAPLAELEAGDAQASLELFDFEIVRAFLALLQAPQEAPLAPEKRLLAKETKARVLKTLAHLVSTGGDAYLAALQTEGLLDPLIRLLFERISSQTQSEAPVEQLEVKISNLRRAALEHDVALAQTTEPSASVMNKKQLVIQTVDSESGELVILNAPLASAINLHGLRNGLALRCHLQRDVLSFVRELETPPQPADTLLKQYGMVFFDGVELAKLDDKAVNVLLHAQAVVTTTDADPNELFSRLVELAKKDGEKPAGEQALSGLLEAVVLFLRRADFERVQQPLVLGVKA